MEKTIQKKILIAKEIDYPINVASPSQLQAIDLKEKDVGNLFLGFRITNRLNEKLIMINEFGEVNVIDSEIARANGTMQIMTNHTKIPIEGDKHRTVYIDFNRRDFDEHLAIYVKELNIVITTMKIYQYYDIRHPYGIMTYDQSIRIIVEKMTDAIMPLAMIWFVNEPKLTNKKYYMNFGDEILTIPKTNYSNDEITFDIIKPEGSTKDNLFKSHTFSLKELDKSDIIELTYLVGKTPINFFISTDPGRIVTEVEKKRKYVKHVISKQDHDDLVESINLKHQMEIDQLVKENISKMQETIDQLTDKLKDLETENIRLKYLLDKSDSLGEKIVKAKTNEATIKSAESKQVVAEHSVTKEKISIWSDIMKYGLGGLITLVTILVAQSAKK